VPLEENSVASPPISDITVMNEGLRSGPTLESLFDQGKTGDVVSVWWMGRECDNVDRFHGVRG